MCRLGTIFCLRGGDGCVNNWFYGQHIRNLPKSCSVLLCTIWRDNFVNNWFVDSTNHGVPSVLLLAGRRVASRYLSALRACLLLFAGGQSQNSHDSNEGEP